MQKYSKSAKYQRRKEENVLKTPKIPTFMQNFQSLTFRLSFFMRTFAPAFRRNRWQLKRGWPCCAGTINKFN